MFGIFCLVFRVTIPLCDILNSIIFSFSFLAYVLSDSEERASREKKKLFVVFLLLFPFVNTMCGLRYFTAVSWLLYCNYLLLYCRNIKGAIIPLIVVLQIHFAIVVQIIVLLLSFVTKIKQRKYTTLIIVVSLCALSVFCVNRLMPYLYIYFPSDKVDQYADEGYMDVLEGQNLNFYIAYWTKYITWFPLALLALFVHYKKIYKYKMFSSFWCMLLLWAIGSGFTTLEYRWSRIAALFFFLCYL